MNYYDTLGVNHTTSPEEIKRAYKRLASKHHPDKGGDENEFKKIQEAYDVLGDPNKKAQYDNPQPTSWEGFNSANFNDIFGDIFGPRRRTNPDSLVNLELTLHQAYTGTTVYVDLPNETVSVQIPAGIRDGAKLRVPGKGMQRDTESPPGDLYVVTHIRMPRNWVRQSDDLYMKIEIDSFDAMLGTDITVEHVNGKKYNVKIPKGIQSGEKVRLSNLGMINTKNGANGSMYVIVSVRTPNIDNDDIIKLLNTIREQNKGIKG